MWNISKLLSGLWGMLGLIALITLFIIYANFPEHSSLTLENLNREIQFDKNRFFYISAGLFLTVNLMTYLSIHAITILKKASFSIHPSQQLKIYVALKTLVCGANFFLFTGMIYTKYTIESQISFGSWHWLVIMLGPLVIVLGLFYLLYVILRPGNYS